jgi:CRP/FNR family cyclic AMP-dependent transcriptional regulator
MPKGVPTVRHMNTPTFDFDALFRNSAHPGLQALARQGQLRHYRKNTLLVQQGDMGQAIYLVLSGRLREFAMSSDSKPREITLAVVGAGQLLGATALDGGPQCASLLTLTPVSCAVVSREAALSVIRQNPALAMDMLQLALQRLRLATETTCLALFSDAYSRLSALLQRQQAQRETLAAPGIPPMTHAQMAQHIGCSREMVSRILKELVTGGYVVREPDKVYRVCKRLPMRW